MIKSKPPTVLLPEIMDIPESAGIYSITNTKDGKRYIGQSQLNKDGLGIYGRCRAHLGLLRRGGDSVHLQNAWNLYGSDVFIFEVLALCTNDECSSIEEHLIKTYKSADPVYGYNISRSARGAGSKSPETVRKIQSEKSRQLRSIAMSDRHWVTDGFNNRLIPIKESIPIGFALGYTKRNKPKANPENKGWTTGYNPITGEQLKIHISDPRYVSGEIVHIANKKWQSVESKKSQRFNECEAPLNDDRARGSIWINNGIKSRRIPKGTMITLPWVLGRLPSNKK